MSNHRKCASRRLGRRIVRPKHGLATPFLAPLMAPLVKLPDNGALLREALACGLDHPPEAAASNSGSA
jgi:hypothetical protein